MGLTQRVAAICALSLGLGCGGRTSLEAIGGHAGGAETGDHGGATGTDGHAGRLQAGGSAGGPVSAAGAPGLWVARDGFDEISTQPSSIRHFAVSAAGDVYVASEADLADSKVGFYLTRLGADGRMVWSQRLSGGSVSLAIDETGIYQLRDVNEIAVVDKRTLAGEWVWSRQLLPGSHAYTTNLRIGRDGALYVGTYLRERLFKIGLDGDIRWTWKGPGDAAVFGFDADVNGTVRLRTGILPEIPLPSPNKGDPPPDGLLWTLDPTGAELAHRQYPTSYEANSGYLETGPFAFVVTPSGHLLSGSWRVAGLFDAAGDPVWTREFTDADVSLNDGPSGDSFQGVLSAGRCRFCIVKPNALYAFDVVGNRTDKLRVASNGSPIVGWAADELNQVYVLLERPGSKALRRYAESAWTNSD